MNASFLINSFLPTFLASILGSTHCLAMCGGFSCLAGSNKDKKQETKNIKNISLYNFGRLISYLIIVNIIFAFDVSLKKISILSSFSGILLLGVILSQLIIVSGLGGLIGRNKFIKYFGEVFAKIYGASLTRIVGNKGFLNTFFLGALTALIPCGWLYLNLGLASAQDTSAQSNLLVLAFWLGTVPALSFVGLGSSFISGKLKGLPKLMAYIIIILLSIYSLSRHFPEVSSRVGLTDALCHLTLPQG